MLKNYTPPDLQAIFKDKKLSPIRREAINLYHGLEIHIEGEYPFELINERRPNESAEIKEYRHKIYQNVFKSTTTRILTSLSKARKAEGFNIVWPVDNSKIPDDYKLKKYVTEDMPLINSIINWGFETLLKMMLMDANAICVVVPLNKDAAEEEWVMPFPHIFHSEDVHYVNYLLGIVILRGEKEKYTASNGAKYDAEVYWVIDKMKVEKWVQYNSNKNFELRDTWEHGLDELPCFTLGGVAVKTDDGCILYESFIQGIVAWMNEAVREYSDLQAEVVQHIHSTFWAISSQECTKCQGAGKVQFDGEFVPCKAEGCNNGKVNVSPFSNIIVQQSALNPSLNIPTPPAGYVQKDIEIVKVQWERIKEHIYNALASINMQFLDNVPLAQSGLAKSVDRDELDNFVHSVTTKNIQNIEHIIYLSARIRYRDLLSKEEVLELLPTFRIPMSFDLMNSSYLISEIDAARKANVSPLILSELEKQLAAKKFQDDPDIHAMVEAQFDLDPLLGVSQDDKMMMLQNNGISQTDYVISCNLPRYIQVAFETVQGFRDMTLQAKRMQITKLAEAEIQARKASTQIIPAVE